MKRVRSWGQRSSAGTLARAMQKDVMIGAEVEEDHSPFVTTSYGLRGWFAVLMCWDEEDGGFWDVWQSGIGSYKTRDRAEQEAKDWAMSEGIRYGQI